MLAALGGRRGAYCPDVRRARRDRRAAQRVLREGLGIDRVEIERIEERGDLVAAAIVLRGRAPASGTEMEYPARGLLWTFRSGRIARLEWFVDPQEAFGRLDTAR